MKFNVGDKVKVIGNFSEDEFIGLHTGLVATIAGVWEDVDYPYELEGYSEQVAENEIELTEEELTDNESSAE